MVVVLGVLALVALVARRHVSSRRSLGGPEERATFATLHTASLAAPPLREGLTVTGAERAARHLRSLLGTPAVALTRGTELLAWDGTGEEHGAQTPQHAAEVLDSGRTVALPP